MDGSLLRWRIGCGGLPQSGHGGALAGTPVARTGPTAAGSDAAHLLDALVEQIRDVGHGAFLGAPPVIPWWGATRQGKNAGSAKINGIKRRWSGWSAGSACKTSGKRACASGISGPGAGTQATYSKNRPVSRLCALSRAAAHSLPWAARVLDYQIPTNPTNPRGAENPVSHRSATRLKSAPR